MIKEATVPCLWSVIDTSSFSSLLSTDSGPVAILPRLGSRPLSPALPLWSAPPSSFQSLQRSSREPLNGTGTFQTRSSSLTETQKEETARRHLSSPFTEPPRALLTMATNREQQLGHMTGFPRAMYPFTFNSMRSHSPFDLLASSNLFGRFGADLPKEMAALCE